MPQHITVVNYDPEWPRQFQAEAARIRAVLGDNCTAIYHIGSTAVPGLAAKPILDIMPVVENLEAVDRAAPAFEAMGYEYLGEFGIPGRRYLRKGGDERTHQLHIFARTDRANITRHLAVRDYLRAHRCVIEGICHRTRPIFGLQWHPELLVDKPVEGTVDPLAVFSQFASLL